MTDANSEQNVPQSAGPAPFICKVGAHPSPFVFALPHSGRHYPEAMRRLTPLSAHSLRLSEDAFVDRLFKDAPDHGATLLVATHARAYLDLNRGESELDAGMFNPPLDPSMLDETHRVKAGLGIIPKVVAENLPIYTQPLPAREAFFRIETLYRPYHEKLRGLLTARQKQFGYAVVVDCHSMPSDSRGSYGRGRNAGPEIVLGDNWGTACDRELTSIAEELLIRAGFKVRRNVPYSGGYTTQHYGAPSQGIHALQIEISRAIYMNEKKIEPLSEFEDIRKRLQDVSRELIRRFHLVQENRLQGRLPRAAE